MSTEDSTDTEVTSAFPVAVKPTIQILIYTDDPNRVREDGPFGIAELRRQIATHLPAFADIRLTVVSRNSDKFHHADHLLDRELARGDYDQVWMFGIHQINKGNYTLAFPGGGGPRSELLQKEIDDLNLRMSVGHDERAIGIGVLVAGDHANPPPTLPLPRGSKLCPPHVDHKTFLGLGRALGKHVPRGGELRVWEGPPTHCCNDNFNTQVLPVGGVDLNDPVHQSDCDPQRLTLPHFDSQGNPSPSGTPHALFKARNGKWIQVLPDHDHEGAVTLPKSLPKNIWPRGQHFRPEPRVIALGMDHRTGRSLNIVAAYDGNVAGVGRIVADSSWHHYFNINLKNLSADMPQSADADLIGQFYSNLAVWLCPLKKRREMGVSMIHWLANHPLMLEEAGSGALNVGTLARGLLAEAATGCEIEQLLIALSPDGLRESTSNFIFTPANKLSPLPSIEVLLGSILHEYFSAVFQNKDLGDESTLSRVIHCGFETALGLNALDAIRVTYKSLLSMLTVAGDAMSFRSQLVMELLKSFELDELTSAGRETVMDKVTREEWFYELQLDRTGESETVTLILYTNPAHCEAVGPFGLRLCRLTGEIVVSPHERYTVTGTRLYTVPLSVINIEFPFRHVRLMASGVVLADDSLFTRFIAHDKDRADLASQEALAGPINPGSGDTGTGTGTTTLLESAE